MPKKKINSIERLAAFTQEEFFSLGRRMDGFDQKLALIVDTLDLIRHDLRDVKIVLGPLVRTVADLESRVARVEKRVGIAK